MLYALGAAAGQRMQVQLEPTNLATYFNVCALGKGQVTRRCIAHRGGTTTRPVSLTDEGAL